MSKLLNLKSFRKNKLDNIIHLSLKNHYQNMQGIKYLNILVCKTMNS
jgi:hypothetical protein